MKEALKLSLALTLTCVIASSVLAFANTKTKTKRDEAEMTQRAKALSSVLPEFDNQPMAAPVTLEVDGETFTFYLAMKGKALVGIAGEGTSGRGFGGDVSVLVGLEPNGKLGTIVVTGHKETPGLGTQATDRKAVRSFWSLFCGCSGDAPATGLAPCAFLDQFTDQALVASGGPFTVKQDSGALDAVSGATVTSRAVADAVSKISAAFAANRAAIAKAE
ncbi:MAG: RnfABCDGE type electron transport complex subunit G [Lentisphaerae bacterium]|jgi:Na+-translocating ferredoxin:NAD+ oxidoreductase subunit G|nr:RnfABCDGE type electron transport complex subunit G [Lentisphaerota bacterium]MBT4821071.1 RnfABCDGE type electron transport complex subunit G [Lentisphaerota bacterium]MBT5607563.1 RnfABCDGE type electron transport complex subunit G [Lentisphaerota bacterium]MBT7054576.1 RnfABCDGE type electron transport complex subunit G [Lentisphaerota bacterium]MBT7845184.1 RnfABCDGE type electron transport complex subunit G [Lentisphaerota bacterium]